MKGKIKKTLPSLITTFILFFFCLSPLLAAWSTPVKISDSAVHAVVSQVTTDTKGYIHVVWDETDLDWTRPNPGIYYSRWNGDVWSTPLKISANTTGFADNPAIASDSNNVVHVVYADDTYGPEPWSSRIAYTKRNTDGSWTAPVQLPDPPGNLYWTWNPKIAVDSANNLHVSFYTSLDEGRASAIYHTKWEGADWSTPELVSFDESMTQLTYCTWSIIRGDKLGNIHLIYWSWLQGIFYRKLSGGTWSTPVQVTADRDIEYTEMTIDDAGNPYVSWFRTQNDSVWVRRTDGGTWQTPEQVSVNAVRSWWGWPIMGITTTSKGIIAVGWGEEGTGGTVDIVYQYYTPGVGWSSLERVMTERINADNPYLQRDLWDNQHLVWTELSAASKWELWYSVVQGTQKTIGSAGGTVTADPGGVTLATLTIPSGVLSTNTEITILIGPLPESVDPQNVTIPRAYTFGPAGQTFSSPVTAVFTYTVAELSGADPRSLGIYVWDTPTSSWSYKTGNVNTGKKTVTIDLDHFSLFGLSAPKFSPSSVSWLPPLAQVGSYEPTVGSTIPIKFTLSYLNGEPMIVGDIKVTVSSDSLSEPLIFPFGTKGDGLRFDEEKGHYILNLHTKEYELAPGEYRVQVNLNEEVVGAGNPSLLGTTTLALVEKPKEEKGKPEGKGKPTPTPEPTVTPGPSPTPTAEPTPSPAPSEEGTPSGESQ